MFNLLDLIVVWGHCLLSHNPHRFLAVFDGQALLERPSYRLADPKIGFRDSFAGWTGKYSDRVVLSVFFPT